MPTVFFVLLIAFFRIGLVAAITLGIGSYLKKFDVVEPMR